jgi:foldase protein PrsA
VATVNGQAITRSEIDSQLEAKHGDSALRQLIDYSLVLQKLKAENFSVSDAEVNKEIENLRKANPDLDGIIKVGGVRLDALHRRAHYEIALNMLLTEGITVDDKTLKTWFQKHHQFYDLQTRVRVGFLLSSSKKRADTMETELNKKTKTFQQLADEQKKANDQVAQQSTAQNPAYLASDSLPASIRSTVLKLKKGEISKVLSIGYDHGAYVVVRVVDRQEAHKADFSAMHDELEMDYKLEQVARKLNSENPSNPPLEKSFDQVKALLQQQNQSSETPQYRDILNFVNQTAVNRLLQGLRTAAKVDIEDPAYKAVGDDFKPVPGVDASAPASGAAAPAPNPESTPAKP